MNTSPYVDPHKPSQEIWEEFSMSFTPAVREVVEFAKRIPGFRDLPEHDQVSLLKAGTFEVRGQNRRKHSNFVLFCVHFEELAVTDFKHLEYRIHTVAVCSVFPNSRLQTAVCTD